MRWLICTLKGSKSYGPAIASWWVALNAFERAHPGAVVDHVVMRGVPVIDRDDFTAHKFDYSHEVVTRKYQAARSLFIAGEWDVFVAVEDDMVLPVDAFIRLKAMLDGGADVGYGLYTWRHGVFANRANHWSAYTKIEGDYGWSISMDRDRAREAFVQGDVVDVVGVGLGCTAIKRGVLEVIPFERRGQACCDWYFAIDARERGFVQRCDLGLVCGHYSLEPSPVILYPDPFGKDMRRWVFQSPEAS
jgi:hypothetical protein